MKNLTVVYKKDLVPYIQISPEELHLNLYYCKHITPEFLKAVLKEQGYENVTDTVVEQIIEFSQVSQEREYFSVSFSL
jgi:hypothetical protein